MPTEPVITVSDTLHFLIGTSFFMSANINHPTDSINCTLFGSELISCKTWIRCKSSLPDSNSAKAARRAVWPLVGQAAEASKSEQGARAKLECGDVTEFSVSGQGAEGQPQCWDVTVSRRGVWA